MEVSPEQKPFDTRAARRQPSSREQSLPPQPCAAGDRQTAPATAQPTEPLRLDQPAAVCAHILAQRAQLAGTA